VSSTYADVLRSISRVSARELQLIAASVAEGGGVADAADKVSALIDAVRALDAASAPYALIGGVAVGLHSRVPRATLDTNLTVHTAHRGSDLVDAFDAAGFDLRGEYDHSVNFRHVSGEPLQLAFDPEFDAMIGRAETFAIDGTDVRVVTKDDLVAMKRRAAADPSRRRSKALRDQADVALLLGDVPEPDEGW
jgi:hypothetical protein